MKEYIEKIKKCEHFTDLVNLREEICKNKDIGFCEFYVLDLISSSRITEIMKIKG